MNDQQQARDKKLNKWRIKHASELQREQTELENIIPEETILADGSIRQDYPNGFTRIVKGIES